MGESQKALLSLTGHFQKGWRTAAMFILVAYDVSSNRRRKKVAKVLGNYGDRVNLSVFECEFKKEQSLEKLKEDVKAIIKPKKDHVRYYTLCEECRRKTVVQGFGKVEEPEPVKFA
jgi:CRISPR-associated protein Cas2